MDDDDVIQNDQFVARRQSRQSTRPLLDNNDLFI